MYAAIDIAAKYMLHQCLLLHTSTGGNTYVHTIDELTESSSGIARKIYR